MITYKCDICNSRTTNLNTMILHKKTFDYCQNCKEKAEKIKNDFREEIKQEYILYESRLKKIEQDFYYKKIKKHE